VAIGRVTQSGQINGGGPDQKGHPDPPDWGLGVGLTTTPREQIYVQKTSEMPRTGLINRRRLGWGVKLQIGMNGCVLWGRPRPGRGCSAIYGWMDLHEWILINSFVFDTAASSGPRSPHSWDSQITQNDPPQSVGLLWDELSARRRDLYLTTHNTHDKCSCPRRESNTPSQKASGLRHQFHLSPGAGNWHNTHAIYKLRFVQRLPRMNK
jgi:hypothetical protein